MTDTMLYIIIITLGVIASATALKLYFLKRNNYKPSNGEIYNDEITVALTDAVFETHDSKVVIGTVDDYISSSFDKATLTIALPYEAVAKSGRFLVKVKDQNITKYLWVEPTNIKKEYFLKAEKLDRFENVSSNN